MDKMRRILVFKLTEGDFYKWKSLGKNIDKIATELTGKVYSRKFNKKNKTCTVDISFKSEEHLIQEMINVTEFLSEHGLKEELISRKRILPKEIERDLKEFKQAVSAL